MKKYKTGFTLIELLIVIIITGTLGSVVGSMLFSSLRGVNKTNQLIVVRQNGNYALLQMQNKIRNAQSLDGVSINTSGSNATNDCTIPVVIPTPTPVAYKYIKVTASTGSNTFVCDTNAITQNGALLIDTNAVALVSCSFSCTQASATNLPSIGISFQLSQAGGSLGQSEKIARVSFSTLVNLRNLNR